MVDPQLPAVSGPADGPAMSAVSTEGGDRHGRKRIRCENGIGRFFGFLFSTARSVLLAQALASQFCPSVVCLSDMLVFPTHIVERLRCICASCYRVGSWAC